MEEEAASVPATCEASPSAAGEFGTRYLENKEDVLKYNSWDQVAWDPVQKQKAIDIVQAHQSRITPSTAIDYQNVSAEWEKFYTWHEAAFFKDRHWFQHAFPHFFTSASIADPVHVFEAGCGAGNSIFPLLEATAGRPVRVSGCDFSPKAVSLVHADPRYDASRCNVFVADLSQPMSTWSGSVAPGSVDLLLLVFVLSAVPRARMPFVLGQLRSLLKPDGVLFLRDYGLYDLAQLRLKAEHWVEGSQYRRGDGTLMYFFTLEEIEALFIEAGFKTITLKEDRRLLVNRKRQLEMYRVWIQAQFSPAS